MVRTLSAHRALRQESKASSKAVLQSDVVGEEKRTAAVKRLEHAASAAGGLGKSTDPLVAGEAP
jgi:hypothetical protein